MATTTVDTIRAIATYVIAGVVVVGGLLFLYFSPHDPASADTRLAVVGFISAALTFVFSAEVQTRTARQAASQTLAATNGGSGGGGGAGR